MVYMCDSSKTTRRAKDGQAQKTLVATFPGAAFVAETEDGALNVYLISDSDGGVTTGANVIGITDAAKGGMTAAKLQRRIEERRRAVR